MVTVLNMSSFIYLLSIYYTTYPTLNITDTRAHTQEARMNYVRVDTKVLNFMPITG